jgi:hypothetical protein
VLGLLKDRLGSYTPGFILFSLFALSCVFILGRTLLNRPTPLPVAANAP